MEKLCNEFYEFCEEKKILSEKFVKRYSRGILEEFNASEYLKKIIYNPGTHFDDQTTYNFKTKNIEIYLCTFIKFLEEELGEKFDSENIEHIMRYNILFAHAITHECMHGVQCYIIANRSITSIKKSILKDAYRWFQNNYSLYSLYDNYIISPLETNAEIEAKLFLASFINLLADTEAVLNNNCELAESILNIYTFDGKISSPTEQFYSIFAKKDFFDKIMEEKMPNYERMILGLPLDDYFLSSLEDIRDGKTEVNDVKKYLKKI